ncbi:MAG: tRNA (guanosine(46)-N7)-methyltransferase TrmB [Crocinitomicaceae bacterium]|nr:tRNA (guanosine(46)-N7)-methyltransferase TrmB [Crocinitomicaceae bacterium]
MGKDKLKRFAEVETFNNVIQPDIKNLDSNHETKGFWHIKFGNSNPIILELGCGKGEYTVGLAKKFPNINFIGIDIKGSRIWRGAKTCIEENIQNVFFLRSKVDFINHFFDKNEVSEIWLTFSDPQPKKPRKRLTSPLFIDRYKKILKKEGVIHLKTDSDLLYEYTLDEISSKNYEIINHCNDVHGFIKNNLSQKTQDILSIKTFYESIWINDGKKIKYVCFSGIHNV